MKKIRVGVIGLGFIGKQHVEALRRLPYIEIVAGADSNLGMREWCEKNGIQKYYSDYKEMLTNEKMDVVHNCTPNNFHYEVSCEILKTGCHVYSEKPLTIKSVEGESLIELADKKGLKTAVNFNYRNNLMVQEIQQRIQNGRMGMISHIQVEYLQDWLLYDTDFDWRVQKDKGGESRAVADIGSHCFDTIQFITGEKIVSVYAMFHKQYQKRYMTKQADTFSLRPMDSDSKGEPVSVENEDAAIILFRLEGGMVGNINVTQVCAGKKNNLKILISGTKEAYEWQQETPANLWIGHKDSGNEIIYAGKNNLSEKIRCFADLPDGHSVGWKDAFEKGFEIFYGSILNETEAVYESPDFAEGWYVTKIVEACLKSNQTGQWQNV